ncbi:hypothetical protein [Bacillus thuringiensis]|uniref:hypothetical protein n=1 Tax=Bacillus thuringiensis TaxID=1428 RepID=UPI0011A930CC|nr:hypothetical protein [Bacillus thuringiensis]
MGGESIEVVGNEIFYLSDRDVYGLFGNDFNMVSGEVIRKEMEWRMGGMGVREKSKGVGGYFEGK